MDEFEYNKDVYATLFVTYLNAFKLKTLSKMYFPLTIAICFCRLSISFATMVEDSEETIEVVDLTKPTDWKSLTEHYNAVEKHWKVCVNCGSPSLGTAMHLEHSPSSMGSMYPAVIPSEYLLTRLVIVDVSSHVAIQPNFVLLLEMALQWPVMKRDPLEPTLLLFKFGWKDDRPDYRKKSCVCNMPGISYELAEWIAANMTHVVGVATDAPTLESEHTREYSARTVANLLGGSGIYMIENVNTKRKIPEHHCMTIAMPIKLLNQNYVPTRLTAFCPTTHTDKTVVVALRTPHRGDKLIESTNNRVYDVSMDEIMTVR